MLPVVLLIAAAIFCTIAGFWYPNRVAGPFYNNIHFGWLGVALYFWSIVFFGHHV
jgi:hypothetical protein